MTDDFEKYRRKLLALQDELQASIGNGSDAAATVELDQARVGRLSRMDALQAQAMAQAGVNRSQQKLRQIAAALLRLERGEFGECISCAANIDPKRIAFDPAASLCIECASRAEN